MALFGIFFIDMMPLSFKCAADEVKHTSVLYLRLNLPSLLLRHVKENVLLDLAHIKNVRTGYFAISHEFTVYKRTRDTTCRPETK